MLRIYIVFQTTRFYCFPPPRPLLPPPPHFYCFLSSTTATTFLLFSFLYHRYHISIVFPPPPPPPPPHFYCFRSAMDILLASQCFPRPARKTLRFVIFYIAGNSLNLAVTAVVGQHSRVTVHCYPLTS